MFPFATRVGADSLVANLAELDASASFANKATRVPSAYYCARNYLNYYVRRNIAVLRYLKKQPRDRGRAPGEYHWLPTSPPCRVW